MSFTSLRRMASTMLYVATVPCLRSVSVMRVPETDVRVGSKVKHTFNVHRHRSTDVFEVADVAINQHDRTGVKVGLNEGKVATRQVVNHNDLIPTTDQTVNEVRTDEARSTRDQGSHGLTTKTARIRQMVPPSSRHSVKSVEGDASIPEGPEPWGR